MEGIGSGTISPGVFGQNDNATGVAGKGKIGVSSSSSSVVFPAVYGQHTGAVGIGVRGDANNDGYGGQFQGGRAQLRLIPAGGTATGPPGGSHSKGEIYMDSKGALFVCTQGGTPGTWRKVTTTAV